MLRGIYKYGLALCLCLTVSLLWAQKKTDRDYLRSGNRLYRDSMYTKAEVDYRKAIEANSRFPQAHFNLGNALLRQQNPKEAMQAYEQAVKVETNKGRLASIYHNMGVIFQSQKDYAKAVEAYKQSLRNNPKDDETRYNLALAQKMLKDQQQDQQNQDQNQQQQKQDQQEDKKDQNKDQQQNKEQQQPPQPQKKDNEMSKENAEQLLNSVMQDEKDVQDKVKKQQVIQGGRLEKDW